jgi:hypothetical protein
VLNDGKAYRGPHFSLKFKRWSRFTHASSTIMSGMVEVEIRGIPEHAWFRSTAENILRDSCWISDVHPDTLQKKDYSAFRVSAWCFDPGRLHRDMDLLIVEPGLHALEKRCLTYKISVSATLSELSAADLGPPPPPPPAYGRRPDGDGGGGEDQDPQSRRSNGSLFQRRPVHLRLGPQLPSGRGAATLAPRAVFPAPSLFLRRSVHLRLDPQMSLGRGAATLAPRVALPAPSTTSGRETAYPVRDPDRDALPSLRIDETPVSEEPQEDRETTVTVMVGQISPGKINSPRIECDMTVGTSSEMVGSPRNLIGPPEMAWNASVSPLRPTGPLETWLPRPVSPQPCLTLETRLPAPVSPHCLPGLLNTTMPGAVSPHIRAGMLEIVPSVHVSPRPRVGTPEMTPDDVLPIEDTRTLKMALPAPVSPQHPPGSLETAASLQTEPTRMLKVYYRRGSKASQFHDGQQDGTGRELLATENGHTTDPRPDTLTAMGAPLSATRKEEFLNKICRRPDACLLIPNKNSKKATPPSPTTHAAAPRRSRRVAGAGLEFSMQDWGGRATKKAMKALQIITEDEGISQEALKAYAELFKHPLSQLQVEALSALFGWPTPPEGPV